MAARSFIILCATLLFLGLVGQGSSQPCYTSNIKVDQSPSGKVVEGTPEWKVTVWTDCVCSQTNVTLSCPNFSNTAKKFDSYMVKVTGPADCQVNQGGAIAFGHPCTFTYTSVSKAVLEPKSSEIACS